MTQEEIKQFIADKTAEGLSLTAIQDALSAQGVKIRFMELRSNRCWQRKKLKKRLLKHPLPHRKIRRRKKLRRHPLKHPHRQAEKKSAVRPPSRSAPSRDPVLLCPALFLSGPVLRRTGTWIKPADWVWTMPAVSRTNRIFRNFRSNSVKRSECNSYILNKEKLSCLLKPVQPHL